ncbi:MAG: hypothetical protein ACI9IT_002511 [Glaciecola sp.]|jgi:hypothetical protein
MTINNKFFVVFFSIFAVINLIDFTYYGQEIRYLVGATGYLLMAYGSYENKHLLAILGAALAIASIAVKYVL